MKSTPSPLIVDLSGPLRQLANQTVSDKDLERIEFDREEFLTRLGCRLILLPSGTPLSSSLSEPPASIIYGKLLYGGVTRYRKLVNSNGQREPRKAGERTDCKTTTLDNIPAWIQYGGAERMYESVDMGPAAVFEVVLLPRGQHLVSPDSRAAMMEGDMMVKNIIWKPQKYFGMVETNGVPPPESNADEIDSVAGNYSPISQSGKGRNDAFQADFTSQVGGLQKQIGAIVRRVLDGRVIRPVSEGDNGVAADETSSALAAAALESEELAALGLTPVRGLLLYGPPGTGKTLLARQIAKALRARAPKIVSAPELLDRWVGGSEKLVRGLFADSEAELAACNGDPTRSALHVIVIDEIDAVFRRRSAGEDSGEATRASVVNQILAKMDGIKEIGNILIIGMTNRRELLDPALLRPGRLEVQIEVPLPDKEGRREILQIHFEALRKRGRLSTPLCEAIDGASLSRSNDQGTGNPVIVSNESNAYSPASVSGKRKRKRDKIKQAILKTWSDASAAVRPSFDLAADANTGGYSGADIAGLVRCAGSLALSRARRDGNGVDGLLITLEDVKRALKEVGPSSSQDK
jgi:vesicle-fusing ATPase